MSNQTQQQIDALIQFINDAEEPGTVTNLIVAAVLVFLSDKVKTMATASALDAAVSALEAVDASLNQAIQDEVTVRQAEDTTLSDRISVLQVALDQLMSVGLISVINNLTEGGTDKALSAEMGKELGQRVESLEASDRTITYDQTTDTFSIVRSPMLSVLGNVVLSGTNKSGTFKVSGSNLKGDVTVRVSASGWKLRVGSGTKAESVTLSPTGSVLAETTVTAIYEGSADSVGNTIVVTSAGAESKTVTASYMAAPLPTISAVSSVQISAIAGGSGTAAIIVEASNLTSGITVTKSGTNASKFSFSPGSLGENGGTLTVKFYPEASDTANQSAKLTLSSAGATPVEITLTGKVQVPSLTVAPTQLNMQSESGSPATGTVNIKGSNLLNDVGLSVSGDGFSVSKSLLTAAAVNAAGNNGIDVTVTRSDNATATSGTLTITSGSMTRTVTLNWEVDETNPTTTPTISAVSSVQISAIAGGSGTAAIIVEASNLTSGITVTKSGTNASKFSFSPGSLGENGGTLTVKFYPEASDTANQSAKLTLSSAGATPVEITLTGKVQVPSLTVAPTQLNMQSESGSPATGTVNIKGSNLLNDVGLSVSGDGFSVSKSLLTAAAVNAAGNNGIDVTITRSNSATATTGTLTITSGSLTRTVTLNWEEEEAETEAEGTEVVRNVGYSTAGTQSPDLWVFFTILSVASGSTHGTVEAYANKAPWWDEDSNFVCDRLILPDYIMIGENYYDVTNIKDWGFGTKNFNKFVIPSSVSSMAGYSFNSSYSKILVLNSNVTNNVWGRGRFDTFDFFSGKSALGSQLNYAGPLKKLVLRKADGIVTINANALGKLATRKTDEGSEFVPCKVYVPNNLITSYEGDTNWATYITAGLLEFVDIANYQENS